MQSFSDLNFFSNNTIIQFEDLRQGTVVFDRPLTLIVDQETTYTSRQVTMPFAFDLVEIVNPQVSQPRLIVTVIANDQSFVDLTVITFPNAPADLVFGTQGNSVVVSGFTNTLEFRNINPPLITFPENFASAQLLFVEFRFEFFDQALSQLQSFAYDFYDVEYYYNAKLDARFAFTTQANAVLQAICAAVSSADLFATAFEALSAASEFVYDSGQTQLVTGTPVAFAQAPGAIVYTLTVTPSELTTVNSLSSSGTGGTSSFNTTTKELTITGLIQEVNSHLTAISLSSSEQELDYTFTYIIVSDVGKIGQVVQPIKARSILFLGTVDSISYDEDIPFVIASVPFITDTDQDGLGTYTYTITPSTVNAVLIMSTSGSEGTSVFDSSLKSLTLTGTRSQVNSRLTQVSVTPSADFTQNFSFAYQVTTPLNQVAQKVQSVFIGLTHEEVSDISVNRSVFTNTTNFPFATTQYFIAQTQLVGSYSRTSTPYIVTSGQQSWNTDLVPRFGTGSLQFGQELPDDQIEDRLIFTPGVDVNLADFTIELWYLDVRITAGSSVDRFSGVLFDSHEAPVSNFPDFPDPSTSGLAIWLSTAGGGSEAADCRVYVNGFEVFYATTFPADQQWHHIAVSRTGSTNRVFQDGIQIGTFNNSSQITLRSTDGFAFGLGRGFMAEYTGGSGAISLDTQDFRGYFDDTRISNTGVYNTNFIPGGLGTSPNSVYFWNWDGVDEQFPPNAPSSFSGLAQTLVQTTPQITDQDTTDPTYTIQFTCPQNYGTFNLDGVTSNSITFTGTKSQCNAKFSQITFTLFNATNGVIAYNQQKNNVTQLNQNIQFVGSAAVAN